MFRASHNLLHQRFPFCGVLFLHLFLRHLLEIVHGGIGSGQIIPPWLIAYRNALTIKEYVECSVVGLAARVDLFWCARVGKYNFQHFSLVVIACLSFVALAHNFLE